MAITLDEEGDGYILTGTNTEGDVVKTSLTAEDVLALINSALFFEPKIHARQNPESMGAGSVWAVSVAEFRVQSDSLGQDLLLSIQTPNERQVVFAFPPHHADRLAREVPIEVAAQRAETKTRQ